MRSWSRAWLACVVLLLVPRPAAAGGYDTPILYSARHLGMGGTAIGYVDDASAVLHNPAGLSGTHGVNLLADLSLLAGRVRSTGGWPSDGTTGSRDSEPIVAPLFMLAAAYAPAERLRVALGVYPVASASAEYRASFLDMPTVDRTQLVFLEASVAVSYALTDTLSLGIGHRSTYTSLTRQQGFADDPQVFDFTLSGLDFTGLRAGLQWRPLPQLGLGLTYRHRIDVTVEAEEAVATAALRDARTDLTLPGKLGIGARYDLGAFGVAADLEYALQSQNDIAVIEGVRTDGVTDAAGNPKREAVNNVFRWQNAVTARLGAQYTFADTYPVRAGYVFDQRVSTPGYPSAFGTPPAASHSVTAGAGYLGDGYQVNFALAYRVASTTVRERDIGSDPPCATCAPAGDFELSLYGLYLDYSITLGE